MRKNWHAGAAAKLGARVCLAATAQEGVRPLHVYTQHSIRNRPKIAKVADFQTNAKRLDIEARRYLLSNIAFLVMMRMMPMLLFFAVMIIMIMLRLCLHMRKSFEPALQPADLIQREQSQRAVLQTKRVIGWRSCRAQQQARLTFS